MWEAVYMRFNGCLREGYNILTYIKGILIFAYGYIRIYQYMQMDRMINKQIDVIDRIISTLLKGYVYRWLELYILIY